MKTLNKYILLGALTLSVASCDLDMVPETSVTDASYWKTEGDLRGACNRFYEQMNGNNDLGDGFKHDYRSDELTTGGANAVSSGNVQIPTTNGAWTDAYWRIFIANNIIEKAPRADVSEAVLNKYLAEARFFRGYYYFELVKKYGDVPLLLKAINDTKDPDLMMPRTPRAEVIKQVYEDLEFAATWLPDIDKLDKWGHVARQAAIAMKVRVGLYEGTHGKYHNSGEDYRSHLKTSIDAAKELITSGKHELYPDFEKLFQDVAEGRQNRENIFVKEYGPNGSAATTTHGTIRQMENTVSVTRNVVDLFLYTDGLPREKSAYTITPETSYDDVFSNRDPRLGMTCYKIGEEAYKGAFTPHNFHRGYSIKKGFDIVQWSTNSKEWTDWMAIRYAEVLISYAEALYEYNGSISDDDLDITVNALRNRVGMPAKLTNAFAQANGLDMLEEIRRERTVEFIDENKRYDDIIRWKIAEKVLPVDIIGALCISGETTQSKYDELKAKLTVGGSLNGKQRYGTQDDLYVIEFAEDRRFDTAKDYLYPVPLYEISQSGGAVTQNPGWK
ncbi:MAG: RagB/SusD family nutrient uptake outer membrane protein [Duncaniella sp.]|uniref:RagB/SusD family nutrient uptake outer membrane protein n=1 Tax=Duncaniella sp. TaxID=2518496 RepID=UPI0023D5F2E1|nr:RagB/SusD family nutrient uptake outer membrane protein [Duncaniella sp.]MDE6090747.1 RagB/SusD family nutrient uptake outer membrane protein [Duncaniella sp.]